MRCSSRLAMFGAGLFFLFNMSFAAEPAAWQVPEEDFRLFLGFQVKVIESALQGQPDQKARVKAEVNAVILASLAQQDLSGPDAAGRATVRDAAVNLAYLIRTGRLDTARHLVRDLPALKPDADARRAQIPVVPDGMDFDDLSLPLKHTRAGGLNIESHIMKLAASKKRDVPHAELNDTLKVMAYHAAVSAQLYLDLTPKNLKPARLGPWIKSSMDTRTAALELIENVRTKSGDAAFQTVNRLNSGCAGCHEIFK